MLFGGVLCVVANDEGKVEDFVGKKKDILRSTIFFVRMTHPQAGDK